MLATTVLLDLDGVVRHFDPAHVLSVEARHGLERGILTKTAFDPELLNLAITGKISRSDWVCAVGERVDNPLAAAEWMAERGTVDKEMVDLVDLLRSAGVVVAVLTNGTDTIADEMISLGLDIHFDDIFSTADLGVAKPDRRAFEMVCQRLDVEPIDVFFTDDSPSKLAGAIEIGMSARLFEGVSTFRGHLAEFGLEPS